ncbi:MAG TPA: DUF2993 domain-containing protein [bacterium]|nr:DUF2993 domain-containing protein [bacterium]
MAVLVGPAVILSSRLQNDVRRDLRARDASVRVTAGPVAIAQGRLARLSLRARGAMLDGASIDEVTLDLRGVTIDPGRAFRGDLVLRRVESGTAVLVVGEESLRRYLAEGRGFRNAGVRMDDGVVTITGQITILNALVDVTLRAGLVVRDGRHLSLDVQQLRVSGLEVPRDVGNALVIAINPILTAPQQPVPLRLTGVTVDGGAARLVGEVAP